MQTLPPATTMYRALIRRDSAYDGIYFVGVKTTGIFCRPTCPAKKPLARNVEFFSSPKECLLAGYRPCRRCQPMDNGHIAPQWVKRLVREVDRAPTRRLTASDLRAIEIDPHRARRYFLRHYGMTFSAYHRARRMGLALSEVRTGRSLAHVVGRHGFESFSGFRAAFAQVFGEPPGRVRKSGSGECLLARWLETPLGPMLAAANHAGLCLLEFVDRRMLQTQLATLRRRFGMAIVPGNNRHLDQVAAELSRYFDGSLKRFEVPVVLRGTDFQLKTWRRLMRIPFGQTLSYSQMAVDVGAPDARRAIGRANGDNRLAIIIPCHRVVRADGQLCGYGGGLWRKKWLLEHERTVARSQSSNNSATRQVKPGMRS